MSMQSWDAGEFSGRAPLFPLPNLVLFPHVMQPLFIFEPRYKQMVADVLAGDKFVAMALIKPGGDPAGRPPCFPIVCLGRITFEQALDEGKFNLILQGICRARILQEVTTDKPYRLADLDLLPEMMPDGKDFEISGPHDLVRRKELHRRLKQAIPQEEQQAELNRLLSADVPLGVLCDILAFTSGISPISAQELLSETNVSARCDRLLSLLGTFAEIGRKETPTDYPPPFSLN